MQTYIVQQEQLANIEWLFANLASRNLRFSKFLTKEGDDFSEGFHLHCQADGHDKPVHVVKLVDN